MSKKVVLLLISAGLFVLFVFFSYLVHKDLLVQLDFNTTVRLQDKIPRRVDYFFSIFSILGAFESSTILLAILVAAVIFVRKKILALLWIAIYGSFHIFELFGKTFVSQKPPPHFMLRTLHPVDFPEFYVSTDYSYPSGHSGRVMFLATILLLLTWNSTKLTLFAKVLITCFVIGYVTIMLVSRIYLGEHWLSDVIAGSILGVSFGLFSYWLLMFSFRLKDLNPKNLLLKE